MTAEPLIALPIAKVVSADARFRCAPYACTLSASAYIIRQQQAATGDPRFALCRDCADGQVVSQQVTTGAPEVRLCAREKCGSLAHEDSPLCLVHTRAQRAVVASARAQGRAVNKRKEQPVSEKQTDKEKPSAEFSNVLRDVIDILDSEGGAELLRALAKTLRKGKRA